MEYKNKKYGRLTILEEIYILDNRGYKQKHFLCKCDCRKYN